ncbi:hypothetical protein [Paraglaciecola chathamensis]|uniref:hypothetical protein n=1 Tax=Paraglaciecola chathamensis TaxID=368405 RepID=UPI002704B5B5|nr:hypothetical protein [Paraglaciecola chathamensis]MDO6560885.1 hypothetical protein [Paraglaciecola chathamensis]
MTIFILGVFLFIIGGILLAVIFSFTAEGVLIIVGAYAVLVILALLFGVFSKKSTDSSYEQGIENSRKEIAINLLDTLDDQSIANKTKLSIEEVKAHRLNN